ncbi:hypothetical protein Q5752_001077 [Cryptotrichosporon argae]
MPAAKNSRKSKTSRFPVARIKKIMQMDEDVGKLASATPVMISKSLECFMQMLIDESTKETRARGSKKLLAHHLKTTINTHPSFDFLRDIVQAVPDPADKGAASAAGPSRRKASGSGAAGAGGAAGVGAGKKRAKRGASDDDEPAPAARVGQAATAADADVDTDIKPHPAPPHGSLPALGTLKRDAEGGGGTGEGGRGMYDDYEADEDFDDY